VKGRIKENKDLNQKTRIRIEINVKMKMKIDFFFEIAVDETLCEIEFDETLSHEQVILWTLNDNLDTFFSL